jgi:hypothetical protein
VFEKRLGHWPRPTPATIYFQARFQRAGLWAPLAIRGHVRADDSGGRWWEQWVVCVRGLGGPD